MQFQRPLSEVIAARFSCRSFDPGPIDPTLRSELAAACEELQCGLFGEPARFRLIERPAEELQRARLGGGTISGASFLLAGAVGESATCHLCYGYLLEQLVLKATDLGLGTCWIAYFPPAVTEELKLATGEICPAAVAVGNIPSGPTFKERVIRFAIGAARRKSWEQLFFREGPLRPVARGQAGKYAAALDMVRYAPSAGNTQPWRVLKARSIPIFNFYLRPANPRYDRRHLHDVDMGIAVRHFELGAEEAGQAGTWRVLDSATVPPLRGARYVISWFGEEPMPVGSVQFTVEDGEEFKGSSDPV